MYYIYAYCRRNFPDSSSVRLNHSPLVLKSPNGPACPASCSEQ